MNTSLRWALLMSCNVLFQICVAQDKLYVGLQGGAQLSSAYIEHTLYFVDMSTDFIITPHASIFLQVLNQSTKKGLKTGFQLGAGITEKGWRQPFRNDSILSSRTTIQYLNVPATAIIWSGGPKQKLFLDLGFFLDFYLNHQSKNPPDESLIGFERYYTYDRSRDNRVGYGLLIGAGTQRDFSFGAIQLSSQISFAFSDFIGIPNRADATPDLSNLYHLSFSIAYLFSLN